MDPTVVEAQRLVRRGGLSPLELVEAHMARIRCLDDRLNAFVTVTGQHRHRRGADDGGERGGRRPRPR